MRRVEIYRDKAGQWRWRAVARNGRILADSGEGYRRQGDCKKGWQRTVETLTTGKVVTTTR